MSIEADFGRPFAEQIEFFRAKLALPSRRWDDIRGAAHDRGFIVAGALKADLVADLHAAIGQAIEEGRSLQWWRAHFEGLVAKHGWTGWTGEGSRAGRAWRTRVIYETNMASSYAAGRWRQLNDPDLAASRPYLKYRHADGVLHPRPLHVAWDGLVLPRTHPFWQTHSPPNGWGCHCYLSAASAADYAAARAAGRAAPPGGWDARDARGRLPGVDAGWDYAPGAGAQTPLREMVAEKLIRFPPAISSALSRDVNRYIEAQRPPSAFAAAVLADRSISHDAWLGFPDNFSEIEAATGRDVRGFIGILPADVPRHVARAREHDGGDQRPVRPADYDKAWRTLTQADRIEPGHATVRHLDSVVAYKRYGDELYRVVYEIRPGKKNRSLALLSLVIKRPQDRRG